MHKSGLHFLSKVYNFKPVRVTGARNDFFFFFVDFYFNLWKEMESMVKFVEMGVTQTRTESDKWMDRGNDMALYFSRQRYLVKTC